MKRTLGATAKQLASVRGKLGALTQRHNDDREFYFLHEAEHGFMQTRSAELHRLAKSCLQLLESYEDDISYYFAKGVTAELLRIEAEFEKKMEDRKKLYDERTAAKKAGK